MRILLVRTSALGDVVHALPVLTALRRHFPAAKIGWIVERAMAPLLEGHPDLDAVIEVRLREWRRQPFALSTLRGIRAFGARLTEFSPDVVFDLMGNHKAGILAALTLADRRIGLARPARREPSSALWISEQIAPNGVHAVDRGLDLLGALGVPSEPADFAPAKLMQAGSPEAAAWLAAHPAPFALIHPGAGWGNKRYPPARWGEVARALRAATGMDIWAAAAPGEEHLATAVAAASDGAARTVEAPSLPHLGALLRGARLVMGGDTGPVHLAHALGTPVVCVMGPTDPARHGPYGQTERVLSRRLTCSYCYRRMATTKACLLDIPAREVTAAAVGQLAATSAVA